MKKTLTFLFLTLLTLALLVACGHAHTYSEEWSGDDDNHWREATCEHTEEKADFGTHTDSDENGKCDTCDATLHQHTYTISWQNDDTKHWHEATCSHDTLRSDEAAHVDEDEDGRCDVCMYDGMHKHVFNTAVWRSDETGHWHPGMCEGVDHSDRKSEFAPHTTAENDGTCDVCGYDDMHIHTYDTTDFSYDDTHHWYKMTCEHGDIQYGLEEHNSSLNNGVCDTCGKDGLHIHTFSDSEYASNAEGHWFKANCGHDGYVYDLQPHVDTEDENGRCDVCDVRLNYTVNVTVKQPERIEVVGDNPVDVAIGEDVTVTVKVDSKYVLFVTAGGGEIVGMPTTEGGITTYTVKVANVESDVDLVLVAKLENAYALSTIPTSEGTTKTVTIYESEGAYSTEDNGGTKYEITYVNTAITTYDADDDAYTVEKVARIVSIKNAAGEETTFTRDTTTYGASGEGVVTEIPVRNWLFESDDSKRNFTSAHSAMVFNSTEVLSNDETLLYTFETDVLVSDAGTGPIFELYLSYGNNNYLAKTALRHDDGKLKVSAMSVGGGEGGFTECGEVGIKVNLRIEVRRNETDATKLDVTLYVNGTLHSTCTVEDKGDLKVRLTFRDDGTDRNNVATFSDARFLKHRLHEHTFDDSEWVYDDYGHWHAASCGHSAKGDYAEHSSATNSGVCDVCEKENIHVHTSSDTEYAHDVNGHWHKANCGHDDYIADREAHVDTADNNGVCDTCERRLVCVVTVDLNSTFALLVTEGEIAAAPGADATFEVSVPATHTLVVVGGEIVGEPTETSGVKVYTVKAAALADDTTVEVYTKRADYTLTLGDVEATTHTVTVFEKDGAFSTTDNGGIKYVITYVNNIEKKLNADLGSYTFTKVARITSIKDANGAATTLEYNGVTYGASGDGVATVIPGRTWLGTDNAFRGHGNYSDIWCQDVTDGETLFHFEADMLIEHNTDCEGTSVIDLFFVDNNGNAATGMSIYYYPGAEGKLTFFGFGVGGVNYSSKTVVEAKVGEVFNLAFDIVAGAEAGTYDVITYVNGEAAITNTISSLTVDSRFRFDMRDDGVDRNAVITISNVNYTRKVNN